MLCNEKFLETHSRVSQLEAFGEDTLAFTTRYHGAYLYNTKERKIRSHITHEHLNSQTLSTCLSPNGAFLAFSTSNCVYIFDAYEAIPVQKISLSKQNVQTLCFDSSSCYLIVGTQDGAVLQYKLYGQFLLSRLFAVESQKEKRAIEVLASSHTLLGCGTQDGTLLVMNLLSKRYRLKKQLTYRPITALHFVDENTLVCSDANGVLWLIDLKEQNKVHKIDTPYEQVSQIVLIQGGEYALIHANGYSLSLVSLAQKKVIQVKYIQSSVPIEKIAVLQEDLFIAQSDSTLIKVNILGSNSLYEAMLHNSLDLAYQLITHNPLLMTTHYYKQLEERYKIATTSALKLFLQGDKTAALEYLEPFLTIRSKQKELKLSLKAFEHYERFCDLCREEKFSLAYALCKNFPLLEQMPPYQKIESHWRQLLQQAQKLIFAGKKLAAKELLHPFITVASKRDLIQLILQENNLFLSFLKACEAQNFSEAMQLAQEHLSLQKLPNYQSLQRALNTKIQECKKELERGHVEKAQEILATLQEIEQIQAIVLELTHECKVTQELQEAYERNDFIKCYELLDTNPSLCSSQLAKLLEQHWAKLIGRCEAYALQANITQVKQTFGELATIPSRLEKIEDILRLSFHVKIATLLEAGMYHNAQSIIYSYIDIFGMDSEILEYMQRYESLAKKKLAITYQQAQ